MAGVRLYQLPRRADLEKLQAAGLPSLAEISVVVFCSGSKNRQSLSQNIKFDPLQWKDCANAMERQRHCNGKPTPLQWKVSLHSYGLSTGSKKLPAPHHWRSSLSGSRTSHQS